MTPYAQLEKLATRALAETISDLPPTLAAAARAIPCLLRPHDPDDPDLLGCYEGFSENEVSPQGGPIILYLESIAAYALDEGTDFSAEVRLTYLHELGHHLGWDEADLINRGLA